MEYQAKFEEKKCAKDKWENLIISRMKLILI